ncbi:PhzF family phenazine biosynthesis protein [Anaerolineales bacterium]
MRSYPFMQVDAFTTQPLQGNPCAIVFEAQSLSDAQMQAIALEMNLSETAFVLPSDQADFRFRYFTPASEIPLAGHPTIATTHALLESERYQAKTGQSLKIELKVGLIDVFIEEADSDHPLIIMQQQKPQFLSLHDPEIVMPIFGLDLTDLLPDYPIQTVSTGTPQLMIPVKDQDSLKKAKMNMDAYRTYRDASDFFSPHLFCLGGFSAEGQTFARHLGLPPDTIEDPFTGSATGGMAAYLWHYALLRTPEFIAEQGHWMGRPGQAYVNVIANQDGIETVRVGGRAVTLIEGSLKL